MISLSFSFSYSYPGITPENSPGKALYWRMSSSQSVASVGRSHHVLVMSPTMLDAVSTSIFLDLIELQLVVVIRPSYQGVLDVLLPTL
jgi:hypothetical protein